MEKQYCYKNFYVVMNESNDGNRRLKDFFSEQFRKPIEGAILETFTLKELLHHLGIRGDPKDHFQSIEKIVEKLDPNSAIFFDETSIVRENGTVDWSHLNIGRRDVSITISFQPLIECSKKNTKPIQPQFPNGTSILKLTKVYRTSKSIYDCVQDSLQYIGIKRLDYESSSMDIVTGRKPKILSYDPNMICTEQNIWEIKRIQVQAPLAKLENAMKGIFHPPRRNILTKLWVLDFLMKVNCPNGKVSILYSPSTEGMAKSMFKGSLAGCLCPWEEFRGCENCVIICLYSSEEDETWKLMNMASRAQQTLIVINKVADEREHVCAEIESVEHYCFKQVLEEIEQNCLEYFRNVKPKMLTYTQDDDVMILRLWLEEQFSFCPIEKISILFTKNTEKDARNLFTGNFESCLRPWELVQSCKNSIIICFFSSEDDPIDLLMLTMSSRATHHLYLICKSKTKKAKKAFRPNLWGNTRLKDRKDRRKITVSQEKTEFSNTIQHLSFEDLLFPPVFLLITSSGRAVDHQCQHFGVYFSTENEEQTGYIQQSQRPYLTSNHGEIDIPSKLIILDGLWYLLDKDGHDCLRAESRSKSPTSVAWEFYHLDRVTWYDASHLSVTCLMELPSYCEVTIKFPGDIVMLFRADGTFCRGRHILNHIGSNLRLYVNAKGCWVVSSDIGGDIGGDKVLMSSRSAPSLCPADPRAARDDRRRAKGWRHWSGGEWVQSDIRVACRTHTY